MRRASRSDILYKLKEHLIEACRVVMLGAGCRTRQASPFSTALTEDAKFAALVRRRVHDSRAMGYELWGGPQCVRHFLGVGYGQVPSRALSARCDRSE